jgi:plastocyanin
MPEVPNNVKYGVPLFVVSLVVFFLALWGGDELIRGNGGGGGGGETAVEDGAGPAGGPTELTVVAKNLAFDKRSLSAGAGGKVTVVFDNQDAGVLHNLAFYRSKSSTAQPLADGSKGNLISGPAKETLTFTAPSAGNYYFHCDVHPDTMNGSFVVK